MEIGRFRGAALVKAIILIVFVAAAVMTVRSPAVKELLTVERLGAGLAAAGVWAPLSFILIYAAAPSIAATQTYKNPQ